MNDDDIAGAALRQGLDRALAHFPPEVEVAARLAEEQAAGIVALSRHYPGESRNPVTSSPQLGPGLRRGSGGGAGVPLHQYSIAQIASAYADGSLDPPTLLDALLARIDAIDSQLNSFVAIDHDGARAAAQASAERWRAHRPLGPLDGIPVGVKDVIDVAGLPTRCHSRTTSDAPMQADAAVVATLRAGGAIILGKLATHEFAIGGPAFDLPFPPARNPWNMDHHPGGSSSGAGAAVAAGLAPLAIGTDTAGSVRNPASACGIVGLKPGRGMLSVEGVVPLAWTLDHIGLLTRSVEDMGIAAAALGIEVRPTAPGRIGYVRHFHTRDLAATPDVSTALDRVAAELGAQDIELPPLGDFALVNRIILQSEGFAAHADRLRGQPEALSKLTRTALLPGAFISAETLIAVYRQQGVLTAAVDVAFETVDILLTASSMEPACRIDDPAEIARSYMLQARTPFNVSGHPALAMMAGLSADGLPLSVQFACRMGEEGRLLAVAAEWERAMGGPVFPPIS
ncbi:amidase [Sphingomonas sp. SUN019]|uniref:amidase n=1 Tax=Sphingomonas sp. SUN019 TaxID=2937788 RepID=UPI0021641621|nr:amidase [Sphingomonas sp. SUN019]UVO50501.1 amidase [Sphingomonas sp. SUN019]